MRVMRSNFFLNMRKKTVGTTLILTLLFLLFVNVSYAQYGENTGTTDAATIESLTAQISQLLGIVASLQAQLTALGGSGVSAAQSFGTFDRNLTVGDRGEDVLRLQKALNSDPRTQITLAGDGSPGLETTYFGVLTKNAVIRFQELYRGEILTPAGLTSGSGYVGQGTRAKLNGLSGGSFGNNTSSGTNAGAYTPPDTSTLTGVPGIDFSGSGALFTTTASDNEGAPGELVTISGNGFSSTGNTVYFGDHAVSGVSSLDGSSASFYVPSDIPKGDYVITIKNNAGVLADGTTDFVVKNPGVASPVIYTISPARGVFGSQVTIYGSGFTSNTNRVLIGGTVIENAPAVDGRELVVAIAPSELADLGQGTSDPNVASEWPIHVYVSNENGITKEPGIFIIRK